MRIHGCIRNFSDSRSTNVDIKSSLAPQRPDYSLVIAGFGIQALCYCALTQVSEPFSFAATFVKVMVTGFPSAVPR